MVSHAQRYRKDSGSIGNDLRFAQHCGVFATRYRGITENDAAMLHRNAPSVIRAVRVTVIPNGTVDAGRMCSSVCVEETIV